MGFKNKLSVYAISIILLILGGLIIMLYPFEFYNELNTTNITMTLYTSIVFGTKASGVGLLYIASEMYNKHFKSKI